MNPLFIRYSLPLMLVLLVSCFEKDEAVQPWPGEVFTISEDVEKNFSYFNFETGQVVSSHPSNEWQLGFDCADLGWTIQLNSGDNWFIWNSEETQFDAEITPPENILWKYDVQSAFPDSTAIGSWVHAGSLSNEYTEHVYLIGQYQFGKYEYIKRLQFFHVDEEKYKFRTRDEDSGKTNTITIAKTENKNFTYYDFNTNTQKELEPDKSEYDIIFCPYYDLVTQLGQTIPYLVRGAFINSFQTTATIDSISAYDKIDYEMLPSYSFSSQRDIIGFNWKDVSIDVGSGTAYYTVKPNYYYVVKTSSGKYYKLRFLSFSIDGISGFPRFEYKELKSSE